MIPVFTQRFSIYYNGNLFLRSYTDNSGNVTIINSYDKAKALLLSYAKAFNVSPELFEIRTNKSSDRVSDELAEKLLGLGVNESLRKSKIISGRGLKYKTTIDRMSDRYSPDKREPNGQVNLLDKVKIGERKQTLTSKLTGEQITIITPIFKDSVDNYKGVWFHKSAEYNKGVSLTNMLAREKPDTKSERITEPSTSFHDATLDMAKIESYHIERIIPETRHKLINKIISECESIRQTIKQIKQTFHCSNNEAKKLLFQYQY